MKSKYAFESYDRILSFIQFPRLFDTAAVLAFLEEVAGQSVMIQTFSTTRKNSQVKISAQQPIHNLHPSAPALSGLPLLDIDQVSPAILRQLPDPENFRFHRSGANQLYAVRDIRLTELPPDTLNFLYCYQYPRRLNQNLRAKIKRKVFELRSRRRIELFIHKQQHALENLSTHLLELIRPRTSDELQQYSHACTPIDCLKAVFQCLIELVKFIECEYRQYLNVNIRIPNRARLLATSDQLQKIRLVKNCILTAGIGEPLTRIVFEFLDRLQIENPQDLTYRELNYCLELLEELHGHCRRYASLDEALVREILFRCNFNSLAFFDYKTDQIQMDLNRLESEAQQLTHLYACRKKFNQRQSRTVSIYDDRFPPIRQQVVLWIEEEIEYRIAKMKLDSPAALPSVAEMKKEKLLSGLSVAQLSYIFNLLAQSGIISHQNHRDIFRFIADNFKTGITDQISVDSIKSKYYNVEASTREAVRGKIIELLNLSKG